MTFCGSREVSAGGTGGLVGREIRALFEAQHTVRRWGGGASRRIVVTRPEVGGAATIVKAIKNQLETGEKNKQVPGQGPSEGLEERHVAAEDHLSRGV